MEFLNQYIVVLVVNICLCVGYIIKHSITFIPNKYIPLIMAVLGIFINIWISGWKFSPEILLGGMVSGLASTGTYEMVKNFNKKKNQNGSE
ncbi:MAG: putative rane protein [Anaerocolumna sp.]|nr:putative rane protein [Anaerocolumna sp.]